MPSTNCTSIVLWYSRSQTFLMASQYSTAFTRWPPSRGSSGWHNLSKIWKALVKVTTWETPSTRSFSIAWLKKTEQVTLKRGSKAVVVLAERMVSQLEECCLLTSKGGWCTRTTRSCSRWLKRTKKRVEKLLLTRGIHLTCPPKKSLQAMRIFRSRIIQYFNTQAQTSEQVKELRSIRIKSAMHHKRKPMTASNILLLS